jgi:hypothetical protein
MRRLDYVVFALSGLLLLDSFEKGLLCVEPSLQAYRHAGWRVRDGPRNRRAEELL